MIASRYMRPVCFIILLLVFLVSPVQAEDGGVLTFNSNAIRKGDPDPWSISVTLFHSYRPATMQLDGAGLEKVFAGFSSITKDRIAVSADPPNRLFIDQNGDGKCQSEEIYRAAELTPNGGIFEAVPQLVTIGGITHTLLVDYEASAFLNKFCHIRFKRVRSGYEGKVRIVGVEYPALLVYRNLYKDSKEIDGVILLDTNHDGSFDQFQDSWMLCKGTGYFGGDLWNVTTVFNGEAATVTLTPYAGETGIFQVTGEGVLRIYLQVTETTHTEGKFTPNSKRHFLCLGQPEKGRYVLPVGCYRINEAWIGSSSGAQRTFQLNDRDVFYTGKNQSIAVIAGATVTEHLGGPLTVKVETDPDKTRLGYVFLDPKDFQNSEGVLFTPTGPDGKSLPDLTYEIRNGNGRVVMTGQFEYG